MILLWWRLWLALYLVVVALATLAHLSFDALPFVEAGLALLAALGLFNTLLKGPNPG